MAPGLQTVRPWPLAEIVSSAIEEPAIYRVMKMRFGRNDRTEDKTYIVYNSHITLTGIPEHAYRYRVNGKSAVEWIMDRYQVRTDSETGIVQRPERLGKRA